jgi:selenocysteine lyase/cysteine desulfurase
MPIPQPGTSYVNPFAPSSKSAFVTNFEFVGTIDNAPYLCIPAALKYREEIGGEAAIMAYNSELANKAAAHVAGVLGTEVLENSTGTLTRCCLTNVRLPLNLERIRGLVKTKGEDAGVERVQGIVRDWMVETMIRDYNTFIAMFVYGEAWWIRLSGQVYLEMEDFEWAGTMLKELCGRVERGEFLREQKAKL